MNKHKELVDFALSTVGITEEGGDNEGEFVELFQANVDGKADRTAWCCAYMLYCVEHIDRIAGEKAMMSMVGHKLFRTKHVQTMWNKTPKSQRVEEPYPGCLVFWRHGNTTSGHCGIIVEVNGDEIVTVEGNTGDGSGIVREGDAVCKKTRKKHKTTGRMRTLGFMDSWK